MPPPAISVRCPRCHRGQFVAAEAAHLPQRCAICGHIFTLGPPVAPPPHLPQPTIVPLTASLEAVPEDTNPETPRPSRLKGLILRVALLTILLSVSAMIAMLPAVMRKMRTRPAEPAAEVAEVEVVEIVDLRTDSGQIQWIDASRVAGLRAGMQVKVLRCEFGEVMARDSTNAPVSAGPGEFLQIFLQITNRTSDKVQYISWYANHFRGDKGPIAAELADDTGRRYPPQRFTDVQDIAGHLPQATLEPGESVRDVLIFALPKPKATGEETLFLQLPAAAVRRTGSFDFKLSGELWQR
ncbi:hypothetical protein NA78x_001553 [Anatilimnocola sp. NA78]|uniref:hypothetical protein n=1 Tax=Anatilimnocola sp. NA78 TaxID=3415683 RepID=UPI003CE4E0CC